MFIGCEEKAKLAFCLRLRICLSVCPSVRSRPSRLSIHLFFCLYLPVCLSFCLSEYRLSARPFVCLASLVWSSLVWSGLAGWQPACLSVGVSVCLSVCLPACMPSTKLATPTCLSLSSAHSKIRPWESAHLSQRWDS